MGPGGGPGPWETMPLRASGTGQGICAPWCVVRAEPLPSRQMLEAWRQPPLKPVLTKLGGFGSSFGGSSRSIESGSWGHRGGSGRDSPWVSLPPCPACPGVSTHLPHHLGHRLHQDLQALQGPRPLPLLCREDKKSILPLLKDGVSRPQGY